MIKHGINGDFWEVQPPTDDVRFFGSLWGFLPEDAVFYFEGVYDARFAGYLTGLAEESCEQIPGGTIWPKPSIYHVKMTNLDKEEFLRAVADFAAPYASTHFLVYSADKTSLEFYDAFSDNPLWLSNRFTDEQVKHFAMTNQVAYKYVTVKC